MKRYFIGVPLTDEAGRGVKKVMRALYRKHWKVRWEDENKRHMTLAFLAKVEDVDKVVEVFKGLEASWGNIRSFELKFKGLGAFPDLVLPRVVWLGLKGDLKSLHVLQKAVAKELKKEGVWFDQRKAFHPHVTLGRVNVDSGRKERLEMGKVIGKMRVMDIGQVWRVDRLVLYESVLETEGSRYNAVEEARLR